MEVTICVFSFLLFAPTFCVAHQQLYISNNDIRINFTKLNIRPYSGIQECIEACNIDENCYAFGVKSRMNSEQIDCYINNGTGSEVLDAGVQIRVKFGKEELLVNKIQTENCPDPFVRLDNLPACYYPEMNELVMWHEAEDACQSLHPRAHLISFESLEVRNIPRYIFVMFPNVLFLCNHPNIPN